MLVLPDKTTLHIAEERFQVTEFLFNPTYNNEYYQHTDHVVRHGIHKLAYNALLGVDSSFSSELYNNIVLTGGCSMFPGFDRRFCKELNGLLVESQQFATVRSTNRNDRMNDAWLGAAIISSSSSFTTRSISRAEYEEMGDYAIIRKCYA
jgi:actin-related protein